MKFLELKVGNNCSEELNGNVRFWYLETAKHLDPEIEMDGIEYKVTLAYLTNDQICHRVTQMQW